MKALNFNYLDQQDFQKRYLFYDNGPCIKFFIENIKCGHCVKKIENLRNEIPGVKDIQVHLGTSVATVSLSDQGAVSEVASALSNSGFPPHPINDQDPATQFKIKETRWLLARLGVAAFCAGNIMILALSIYSGLGGPIAKAYEWISFILFLPVILFSALPFFKNSIQATFQRRASIDLPIALAVVLGFVLSTYHLFKGVGDIYFDSLAALVFLLLGSRYLLHRVQQNFLNPNYLLPFLTSDKIEAWESNKFRWVLKPVNEISKNDRLRVSQGFRIPVDGQLLSDSAYFNSSVITGEPHPIQLKKGDQIFAGYELTSRSVELTASTSIHESRMSQILKLVEEKILARTPLTTLTDKAAQYFTYGILILGTLFVSYYSFIDFDEAVQRGLALVILACPCALALVTPLAQSLALVQSIRKGLVIKSAEGLEKALNIKNVIFDKTGTLTEGHFKIQSYWPSKPPSEILQILLELESKSFHPIAQSLVNELENLNFKCGRFDVKNFGSTPQGVNGHIHGDSYFVGKIKVGTKIPDQLSGTHVGIYKNDQLLYIVSLGDSPHPQAKEVIRQLKKLNKKVYLLTGDNHTEALKLAKSLRLPEQNVFSQQSPEEKFKFVKSNDHSLMIGDGANDSLAMAGAQLSLAVTGSMESSLRAADIYLSKSDLTHVINLFEVAQKTRRVVVGNLFLSLFYNLLAGTFALLGFVNPLVAAILMPISSSLITGITLWRMNSPSKKQIGRPVKPFVKLKEAVA